MKAEDIQGWMNVRELDWLRAAAAVQYVIVEIGTWKGRSTAALAEGTPGMVYTCDHFMGSPTERRTTMEEAAGGTICQQARDNLAEYMEVGRVCILEAPLSETLSVSYTEASHPPPVVDPGKQKGEEVVLKDGELWEETPTHIHGVTMIVARSGKEGE